MLSTPLILGVTNWCLIYIAIALYLAIFFCLFKCRRELCNVSMILTTHTCISAFSVCVTSCVMVSSNLFSGFLLNDMRFCYAWGLLYDISECSIYYNYCLQAVFRLCRIVFYKKRYLASISLYVILIICQWMLILILLLPPVFVGWYIRLPTEKYCLIPYTYVGPETYHILLLYLIPLTCLATVYIWITKFMRNTGRTQASRIAVAQRLRNQRDLTVIKRILMLIGILIILRFPTVIFMIDGAITGSLYPFTYGIVGLITSVCLILIGLITINITSQLRKQFLNLFLGQDNRIESGPVPVNRMVRAAGTGAVAAAGVRDNATTSQNTNRQNGS